MKKITSLVIITVFAMTTLAVAGEGGKGEGRGKGKMVERMKESLELTPEQVASITEISENHFKEMKALRDKMNESIKAVLNDEQKKKFEAYQANKKEKRGGRGH